MFALDIMPIVRYVSNATKAGLLFFNYFWFLLPQLGLET